MLLLDYTRRAGGPKCLFSLESPKTGLLFLKRHIFGSEIEKISFLSLFWTFFWSTKTGLSNVKRHIFGPKLRQGDISQNRNLEVQAAKQGQMSNPKARAMDTHTSLSDLRWLPKSWFLDGFFKNLVTSLDSYLFLAGIALEMAPIDTPNCLDELLKKSHRKNIFFSGKFFISNSKSTFLKNP